MRLCPSLSDAPTPIIKKDWKRRSPAVGLTLRSFNMNNVRRLVVSADKTLHYNTGEWDRRARRFLLDLRMLGLGLGPDRRDAARAVGACATNRTESRVGHCRSHIGT